MVSNYTSNGLEVFCKLQLVSSTICQKYPFFIRDVAALPVNMTVRSGWNCTDNIPN
jgi:hypothetical protein